MERVTCCRRHLFGLTMILFHGGPACSASTSLRGEHITPPWSPRRVPVVGAHWWLQCGSFPSCYLGRAFCTSVCYTLSSWSSCVEPCTSLVAAFPWVLNGCSFSHYYIKVSDVRPFLRIVVLGYSTLSREIIACYSNSSCC